MVWFTKGAFRKERLGKKLYFLEDTISLFLELRFLIKNIMEVVPIHYFQFSNRNQSSSPHWPTWSNRAAYRRSKNNA